MSSALSSFSARVMTHQGDEKGVATPYEIDDGRDGNGHGSLTAQVFLVK